MTDKTTTRTIDMTPTWPQAARIIAAALENGTSTGREAARTELFRMADLIDHLSGKLEATEADLATATERLRHLCDPYPVDLSWTPDEAEAAGPVEVFEVIAASPAGEAYGITFRTQAEADAYAAAMQSAGYTADPCPIQTQTTAARGLAEAAHFFADQSLTNRQPDKDASA